MIEKEAEGQEIIDFWARAVAIILHKFGKDKIKLDRTDVESLRKKYDNQTCLVFRSVDETMEIRLVTIKEREVLLSKEKGWN